MSSTRYLILFKLAELLIRTPIQWNPPVTFTIRSILTSHIILLTNSSEVNWTTITTTMEFSLNDFCWIQWIHVTIHGYQGTPKIPLWCSSKQYFSITTGGYPFIQVNGNRSQTKEWNMLSITIAGMYLLICSIYGNCTTFGICHDSLNSFRENSDMSRTF